ncbi:unnamed protein product [Prorocentrum cordatum]|uniref:Uncharacterized protein n=1 Tax=Prorocentrum cordatum TaxID=2364126 RepID=A0ABN9V6P5_9DINO|nr:unnamed protein product [Polarella glacialis]
MYRLARLPKHGSEHRPRPPTPTRREHQPAGQESATRDYCAQARTPHAGAAGAARLGIRGPGSRHDSNKLSESVDRVAGGGPGRDARQRGRGGGGGGEGTRAQTAAAAEAPLRGHLPRSPTGGRGRRQCIVTPLGHHHVETLGKEEV